MWCFKINGVPSGIIHVSEYVNPDIPTHPRGSDHLQTPRLTAYFMCGLMSDLVICKFEKKKGHT